MTESVNTTAAEDEDFYDEATADFAKVEHLAPSIPPKFGPGRLVAIWAQKAGTGKSKTNSEPYPYVETITLVLDDGVPGAEWQGNASYPENTAQLVGDAPVRLDKFQHSTKGMVARLERRLTGKNKAGIPFTMRPYIGRMNTQPSSQNKNVAAYSISDMTDEDKAFVNRPEIKKLIIGINKELEDAVTAAENQAAFE